MQAFHGDKAIKAKYVARVLQHRKLDNIVQGQGWDRGKGCAIGCTLESYDHERYPVELGIPMQIAYLEDSLFEMSTNTDAKKWPVQFLKAIPVGADLSKVWGEWAQWMLVSEDFGVLRYARTEGERVAINRVAEMYRISGTAEQLKNAAAGDAAWDAASASARNIWVVAARNKLLGLLREAK